MPSLKLRAIQRAIEVLKFDTADYRWQVCSSCNCGILSRALVAVQSNLPGIAPMDVFHAMDQLPMGHRRGDYAGSWESRVEYCEDTGRPVTEIMQRLVNAGFTYEELGDLEFLRNPEFILQTANFADKDNVIQYLKSWAAKLAREEAATAFVTAFSVKPANPVPVSMRGL